MAHNHSHLMSNDATPHTDTVLYAVASTATALAMFMVATRVYVRACIVKRMKWDDVFIFIAIIALLGLYACTMATHILDGGTEAPYRLTLKILFASRILYWLAIWAIKMCTLSVCLDIFGQSFHIRKTVIIIGTLATLHTISAILSEMLQCVPLSSAWDTARKPEKCIDRYVMDISQATINLVLDAVVYTLPLILVLKSSINASMKKYMVTIFGIGMITILAGAGRLGSWIIFFQDNVSLATWYILSISSIVEIVTGIIATSIPILGPLAKGQWQSFQKQYSKRTATVTTEQTIALTKRGQRDGDDRV